MTTTFHFPENRERIYQTLCLIVAGQLERVSWPAFSSADWECLIATARAEGVAPLLYHALDAAGWPHLKQGDRGRGRQGAIPPLSSFRHDLQTAYYATAAHNLLIYHELSRILSAISNPWTGTGLQPPISNLQSPISVVVLKGAALATTLYPTPALRPLSDIDLLIPRQDLPCAVQAVQSLGYREPYPEMLPGHNQAAGHHVHLRGGPHQSISVELHWNLVGSDSDWRTPSLDWFWTHTESLPNLQSPISNLQPANQPSNHPATHTLTPTAHLLYLSAHLMLQHGAAQARLLWYYDLHLLVTQEAGRLDWDELVARAREFRWAAALRAALQGAQDRFATPLSAGFLDALAETQDSQAVRSVERKAGPVQTRAVRTWDSLEAQGWRGRLRLAWAIACPSPGYMRWRYRPRPAWLWSLFYVYRWFDIARDGVSTLWRIGKERIEREKGKGEKGKRTA